MRTQIQKLYNEMATKFSNNMHLILKLKSEGNYDEEKINNIYEENEELKVLINELNNPSIKFMDFVNINKKFKKMNEED